MWSKTCLLFLVLLADRIAHTDAGGTFDVTAYGAKGDGKTLNTAAIDKAIAACSQSGGGTVTFPPGQYLTGPFNLTSHMTLFVSAGATILGSLNPEDYHVVPPLPSYCQGREISGPRYTSLIHGEHLVNVTLMGGGVIDGQGDKFWWDAHRNKKLNHTRPRLVELMWTDTLTVTNLTLKNSAFWTLHPIYCNNVVISHMKIEAPLGSPNTDGIDPDSSTNVLITDCEISSGDDHISVKSGMDYCGRQYGRPAANITIQNIKYGIGDGLTIGSETSGGANNITFKDSTVSFANNVVRFKTARGRGGVVSNIVYSNITFEAVKAAVGVNMYYSKRPATNATGTPVITNVTVVNLRGGALQAGELKCLPESPCGLSLSNVDVKALTGWDCENAVGSGVNVSPDLGQCFKNTSRKGHVAVDSLNEAEPVVHIRKRSRP